MSMFSIEPSNLALSLTLGLTLSLSGCQTLPKQPHLPESQALSARIDTLYQQEGREQNSKQKDGQQNSQTTNTKTDSTD